MNEYFSHDYNSRRDRKMIALSMKHNLEGIGAYWCILEMLYEEAGYMPIEDYERIAFELRTNIDTIKSVVEDFGLFKIEDSMFFSESALERLRQRMEKSEKARESVNKRWSKHKK